VLDPLSCVPLSRFLSPSVPLLAQQLWGTNNSCLRGLALMVACVYLLRTLSGTDRPCDTVSGYYYSFASVSVWSA
jgi:hypothetical protein